MSTRPSNHPTKTNRIYSLLRERIFKGAYPAGMRLPASRELSSEFGVSRSLIVEVYEQLISEGYLEARQGSGTYVANLGKDQHSLSELHEKSMKILADDPHAYGYRFSGIDFRPSYPALEQFPRKKWKDAAQHIYENANPVEFGYDEPAGHAELRSLICLHLLNTRGIRCLPSQVVITAGATGAISLLCRLLLNRDDQIVMEDPTASMIHDIFLSAGARIVPVPVDQQGLRTIDIPGHIKPKLVFVTPSHQFPFGSIMSIGRRIELLEYARQHQCYVIEDDYDSEFRYRGMPVRALRELDSQRVIYVGSFSKNLFPALRLGYTVVPMELVQPLIQLKHLTDRHCPTLSQMILARFIAEGHLDRHISRMKRLYSKRRDLLIKALSQTFGTQVIISGDAAGLHFVAEFPRQRFDKNVTDLLDKKGIKVYPAEKFTLHKGVYENRLIMGFGNVSEQQITTGIKEIAMVMGTK